jgi:hypothetical protein
MQSYLLASNNGIDTLKPFSIAVVAKRYSA